MIKSKEEGSSDGIMVKSTLANGLMVKNMAPAYGHLQKGIAIWESGGETLLKDKEFTLTIMGKNMKAHLKIS